MCLKCIRQMRGQFTVEQRSSDADRMDDRDLQILIKCQHAMFYGPAEQILFYSS